MKSKSNQLFFNLLFLFALNHYCTFSQQWIDSKYAYDSTLNVNYGLATNFFGTNDTLKMDIYQPKCDDINHLSKRPLLIWIHGGAFLTGDKSESTITKLCKDFAKRGYVTASINYRLGFVSDDATWSCNYPNYNCVFATDTAEWIRAYYRAVQDAKGALRYLINRHDFFRIDTNNVFVAGESAGAFTALGVGLLDTIVERPIQTMAIANAPQPNANTLTCGHNIGKTITGPIARPDLGGIEGIIEPSTVKYTIKGIGNMYGAVFSDLLKMSPSGKVKPAIFSYHQPCDLVVPIDSGAIFKGLSWCMTNGYGCYGFANTPKVYGSRQISQWNTNLNHGYIMQNQFTTVNFPNSFLIGQASCADQANNPCHAYDNFNLRETQLATFFAPLINTQPICEPILAKTEMVANTLEIFPNPTKDFFIIKNMPLNVQIQLNNLLGERIYSAFNNGKQSMEIPTSHLPNGIYVLRILNEGRMEQFKIIVAR